MVGPATRSAVMRDPWRHRVPRWIKLHALPLRPPLPGAGRLRALVVVLCACREVKSEDPALVLPSLDVEGVIYINVDTLRADRLPAYGAVRDTLPATGRREWLVVHGLRAPASWTLPSVTSLFTSVEPARHGQVSTDLDLNAVFDLPSWPLALAEAGWATGLYTGNNYLGNWSVFPEHFQSTTFDQGRDPTNLDRLLDQALPWIHSLPAGQRYLVHLQPMNLHSPLAPDPTDLLAIRSDPLPFSGYEGLYSSGLFRSAWEAAGDDAERSAIRQGALDVYDASLLGLDRAIERLFEELDSSGRRPLIVLSADHGETLDDPGDGTFGHGVQWRNELSAVPLLLSGPGLEASLEPCLSSNVDVWPTLAASLGVPGLSGVDGKDLARGCRDHSRGSDWEGKDTLNVVGVANAAAILTWRCGLGGATGTRLDEGLDPEERTPAAELPEPEQLRGWLRDARAEVEAQRPEADCDG